MIVIFFCGVETTNQIGIWPMKMVIRMGVKLMKCDNLTWRWMGILPSGNVTRPTEYPQWILPEGSSLANIGQNWWYWLSGPIAAQRYPKFCRLEHRPQFVVDDLVFHHIWRYPTQEKGGLLPALGCLLCSSLVPTVTSCKLSHRCGKPTICRSFSEGVSPWGFHIYATCRLPQDNKPSINLYCS